MYDRTHYTDSKIVCEMIVSNLIGKGPSGTSYANWSKDPKHRAQAKILGIFEDIWPENNGPLPWRLTRHERDELEERMSNVVWPHYIEPMYYKGIIIINYWFIITHIIYYLFIHDHTSFRSFHVVKAEQDVEVKAEVPTVVFYVADSTQRKGRSRAPSSVNVRLVDETT